MEKEMEDEVKAEKRTGHTREPFASLWVNCATGDALKYKC
jgi:hypothetical protein